MINWPLLADRYLRDQEIGIMADRLYSESRGFLISAGGGQMNICNSIVAFKSENW